ncbi:MAG: hypothetical protein PUI79_05475 [Campylobacteraceae bacterium]|nr:hypothetical protein [Campylobacteraceae bacterium]
MREFLYIKTKPLYSRLVGNSPCTLISTKASFALRLGVRQVRLRSCLLPFALLSARC